MENAACIPARLTLFPKPLQLQRPSIIAGDAGLVDART
jgi:hypothetical protein